MAEVERQNEIAEDEISEEAEIEVETPNDDEVVEETEQESESFFENLAEDMDDRTLGRLSSQLIQDYKKDKVSRSDWEQTYTNGLELLGFKY